jgi:hypothetical protein
MAGTIVAGTMLLALHQAIIRVHVSGSEQVHLFAMKNPHIDIYAANNTLSLSLYRRHARLPNLIDIRNLPYGPLKQGRRSFVAVDPMTIMDVPSHFDIKIRPSCWRQVKQLFPVRSGLGIKIFHALLLYVPSQFKRPFESRLQVMTVTLYEVDPLLPWCTQ